MNKAVISFFAVLLGIVFVLCLASSEAVGQSRVANQFEFEYAGSGVWSGVSDFCLSADNAYLALTYGIIVLDVSLPGDPVEVTRQYTQSAALCVTVENDHVAAGLANGEIQLYRIGSGAGISLLGKTEVPGTPWALVTAEHLVCVSTIDSLFIIDILDPSTPHIDGRLALGSTNLRRRDLYIEYPLVYVAEGDVVIVDITNPSVPLVVSRYDTPWLAVGLSKSDTLLYVSDLSPVQPPDYSFLTVLNVRDVQSPTLVAATGFQAGVFDVEVRGSRLLMAAGERGLLEADASISDTVVLIDSVRTGGEVQDLSIAGDLVYLRSADPGQTGFQAQSGIAGENPGPGDFVVARLLNDTLATEVNRYSIPRYCQFVSINGDFIFVGGLNGVSVLDGSQADTLRQVASIFTGSNVAAIGAYGNVLLAGCHDNTLWCIDITNPESPIVASLLELPSMAWGIAFKDNYALIAAGFSGLLTADLSDPYDAVPNGQTATNDFAADLVVVEDHAYVADRYAGLLDFDVSDPSHPIMQIPDGGSLLEGWVAHVAADQTTLVAGAAYEVCAFDITDQNSPEYLGCYTTPDEIRGLALYGNRLVLARFLAGVDVIDASEIEDAIVLSQYNSPGWAENVTVTADWVIVADYGGILRLNWPTLTGIIDYPQVPEALPAEFRLLQNYPNPFNPETKLTFRVAVPSKVRLEVVNVLGQSVATLLDKYVVAGEYSVTWGGALSDGVALASGVYFCKLTTDYGQDTKKMILLR